MKLVALVGKKRVGKDTCAQFIKEQENGSIVYQLAEPIKQVLYDTRPKSMQWLTYEDFDGLGFDREMILPIGTSKVVRWLLECVFELHSRQPYDVTKEIEVKNLIMKIAKGNNYRWSIRLLLTTLGTDIMVNIFDKMFWCNLFVNKYNTVKDKQGYFIVPDIRQEWEIDLVREMQAKLIHLQRDTGLSSTHITEQGLLPKDGECVIINDGTLQEFKEKILNVL